MSQEPNGKAEKLMFKARSAMIGGVFTFAVGSICIYEALGTSSRLDELAGIAVLGLGPALGSYAVETARAAGRLEAHTPAEIPEQH